VAQIQGNGEEAWVMVKIQPIGWLLADRSLFGRFAYYLDIEYKNRALGATYISMTGRP
jgi:hypothetical protein